VAFKASPIARRMAAEAGVDLAQLAGQGSGPDGRIVKVDVERLIRERPAPGAAPAAAAAQPAPAAPPAGPSLDVLRERYPDAAIEDASSMLRAVARRMAEAKATVPHFYLQSEVDMTRANAIRAEVNAALVDAGEKVSVNDLVIRACALALVEHPQFHRSWADGKLLQHPHANVGIAVALEDGLVVPVLRAVETKSLRQIAREARDLAGRARERKLRQHEIEGGTFTVSNLGMFDVPNFGAIINPPEPGILAIGSTVRRPVAVGDAVEIRPVMGVTLSIDHRACSGADGARFLQTFRRYLESGLLLLS
jgi:pyruvate dehydrogenase E2 component (dihydrolipoamide acetyltransferase)